MQLQMRAQMARIGMETVQPFLELRSIRPQMVLQIEEPQLQIHSPRPVLHIDQSQCFADMGKRTPAAFAAYYASQGWSDSWEGIGRIAMEGDLLGHIENNYSLIDLVMQDLGQTADFNVTAIPKQPPRIRVDTYPVEYQLKRGTVKADVRMGRVEGRPHWGNVNIYLRQQNYLEINWVEKNQVNMVA